MIQLDELTEWMAMFDWGKIVSKMKQGSRVSLNPPHGLWGICRSLMRKR